MKIMKMVKFSGLAALVLSVAVGCAGAPAEPSADQVEADQQEAAEEAIADAKAKLEEAKSMGAAWRDTDKMIKEAEQALADGDSGKAIELANQARRQSENAIAQKQAEEERLGADEAEMAMGDADTYTVMRGDNLWNISGRSEIYGNPYHWPLIYKANRDKIQDADLIYPGQEFAIDRSASAAEMDAAARHARTRGAWSLGIVEQSDEAYLAQ